MCTGEGTIDKIRGGKKRIKLIWLCGGLFLANTTRQTEGSKGTL